MKKFLIILGLLLICFYIGSLYTELNMYKTQSGNPVQKGTNPNIYKPSLNTIPDETAKPKGKVEVKSHNKKIERGYTKIVGEVINNTLQSVEYVKVIATFYDQADEVIGTGYTFAGDTPNTPLESGLTTPFEVSSYPDKISVDHYKLDVTWH